MLYATPSITGPLALRLAELDGLVTQLARSQGAPGPWLGALRRQWRAQSAESSIEIEGFRVPEDEVAAIASGKQLPDPSDIDRQALASYARAMDHVGVMASDPGFTWVERAILDLHFDACLFQRDRSPGLYRTTAIHVTSSSDGAPAYAGPDPDEVRPLMAEVIEWLAAGDLSSHAVVRAAMAHLHVVSIHPFEDGNGRISRIVQSLVLARGGLLAPEFLSIEEQLGRDTRAYYEALQTAQAGSYQPDRDASAWVGFCIDAHITQANRRLKQLSQAARRWERLEALVAQRAWPDRLAIALEQSLFDGVSRATYVAEAGVSMPAASGDLRRLVDAGLLSQVGGGRSTRYVATTQLRSAVD